MLDLAGKCALVTGAGRRLGAEIAVALGALGMKVAVHYQSAASGAEQTCHRVRAAGGQAVALQADLLARDAARQLVDRSVQHWGGLDLLVLNAANFEQVALDAVDDAGWDRALALNLTAPFVLAQRAVPALRAAAGSIVMLTCSSRLAPYRDYLPYETSKAGLHQLMRLLALELAPAVRVNAVAPGSVAPPEHWDHGQLQALRERIPLRRTGAPHDVVQAVLYLARASWVTGTEIVVDGGRTLT